MQLLESFCFLIKVQVTAGPYDLCIYFQQDLFAPFSIDSVDELTLGANQLLSEATRLQWNVQDYGRTERGTTTHYFLCIV